MPEPSFVRGKASYQPLFIFVMGAIFRQVDFKEWEPDATSLFPHGLYLRPQQDFLYPVIPRRDLGK